MVKLISKQVEINTLEPKIRLDDVIRSYDLEDTQFEIKVLNNDLDLTDATIHYVVKYYLNGKSFAIEKLARPKSNDTVLFSLPEELKGFDGRLHIGLYAELGEERIDIKDIELNIENSIIDQNLDFTTVNYFESFEKVVEKVNSTAQDAISSIENDVDHVVSYRDKAREHIDEQVDSFEEYAKSSKDIVDSKLEMLNNRMDSFEDKVEHANEDIDTEREKVLELSKSLNKDVEDFEQIKNTAKQTANNTVSDINAIADDFKARKTEFDTVVNGVTTNFDAKVKDLDTYTNEQKLHIDEKTKSFNTLVNEKTDKLTQLNNTFNAELEKSGITLTTAQDLTKRVENLESKHDKDTIYDDTEIKQRIKALEDKPDTEPYDDSEIREMFNSIGEYVGDVLPTKLSDIDNKQSEHTKAIDKLEQENVVIEQKISSLEQNSGTGQSYDDTELRNRIEELEGKEDKDTVYNDSEIRKMLDDVSEYNEVLNKAIHDLKSESTASQNGITELKSTDKSLEERIGVLESKTDNDTIYDDTEIKQSISNVDTKVDNLSEKVTTLEERPIVDTALTERVTALERKEDKDTVYDDSKLVERIENLKSDNTAIKERISALEDKPDKDATYDDASLKAKIAELQEKLKSLNTVRRAPTGYTLDRTTTPWTIWFDNRCGMTIPEYGTTASIYGYGQGQNAYNNNFSAYPLPPTIMSVSHGTLTIEKIKTIEGSCDFWAPGITIINPIRDRNDYDWTNARFNKASLEYAGDPYYSYKYVRQQYFIRTMYELGIWSGEIVEEFGAIKK